MTGRARFQHASGWVWRWCRGSVLCVGPDGAATQLDGAAALVWAAMEQPATPAELLERAAERWAEAPGASEVLVAGAVDELMRLDMVTVVDAP
ncbi:MAG: hypothetical protein JWM47_949 [Acidimicrobiales bacterium]|nr:hypothetical protein [Acidimicrobiales bacterium]